jgi:hypothetical protein
MDPVATQQTLADIARTWAEGLENGLDGMEQPESQRPLTVIPTKHLRLLIADLGRMAEAQDGLSDALTRLLRWSETSQHDKTCGRAEHSDSVRSAARAALAAARPDGRPGEATKGA